LNSYTASEVEKLSGDVNAPPTNMPFHLGGQPFWGVDLSTGKYTGIKGYELLLRYAGTNPMKLHVTASKSLFSSISPALYGVPGHHVQGQIETVPSLQESQIQAENKTNACNFILFQAYWARNLLIQAKGKITFITFNVRADEFVLTCGDGETMEQKLLRISQEVDAQTGGKSYIVYEATEYAPWTQAAKQVLQNLVAQNVKIWIDDVLIQGSGRKGYGIGGPTHSTTTDVALDLIQRNMATGHKFGQQLSSQLTTRGLDRFDINKLRDDKRLPEQFGNTQYKTDQADLDRFLAQKAKEYMQAVNAKSADLPLVIEVSAKEEEITKHLYQALGRENLKELYVQGGDSADYGVYFQDLLKLHA